MVQQFKFDLNVRRICLLVCCLVGLLLAGGCEESVSKKSLPAPLRDEASYTIEDGRVRRLWGGDNFEYGREQELHYIVLRGVDTPKPGQPYFALARNQAHRMMRRAKVRVEVVGLDELKREIADVFAESKNPNDTAGEQNVALEVLRTGFGWYDGTEFEGAEDYRKAEQSAREQRIGLWEDDNPVAPWDFETGQQEQRRAALAMEEGETDP